jgi:hypothetical protein
MGPARRLFDSKLCWVLAPPVAGAVLGAAAGAAFGGLCGLAYGLLAAQQTPLVFCTTRMALAGAITGLLLGVFRGFEHFQEWDLLPHSSPLARRAAGGMSAPLERPRAVLPLPPPKHSLLSWWTRKVPHRF